MVRPPANVPVDVIVAAAALVTAFADVIVPALKIVPEPMFATSVAEIDAPASISTPAAPAPVPVPALAFWNVVMPVKAPVFTSIRPPAAF